MGIWLSRECAIERTVKDFSVARAVIKRRPIGGLYSQLKINKSFFFFFFLTAHLEEGKVTIDGWLFILVLIVTNIITPFIFVTVFAFVKAKVVVIVFVFITVVVVVAVFRRKPYTNPN